MGPDFDGIQQTFPSLLQKAGYQTAVIGKWHFYSDPVGFDHWEVIDNLFEQGTYYNPVFGNANGEEETTGYVADTVTNKAINWLKPRKRTSNRSCCFTTTKAHIETGRLVRRNCESGMKPNVCLSRTRCFAI